MPPGPAHIHGVRSLAMDTNRETVLFAGLWSAIPVDYLLRIMGRANLDVGDARVLPAPAPGHPLAEPLLLRTLRLNCLTGAYARLWEELHEPLWAGEQWAVDWPGVSTVLGGVGPRWDGSVPLRTELERRAALVEIDALVAVWLGLDADQLVTIFGAAFPVMYNYESVTWFDARGRKIAGNFNTFGNGQTKQDWEQLQAHLEDPDSARPPAGFAAKFYKADREREMRDAHAVFSARIQAARDAGWRP